MAALSIKDYLGFNGSPDDWQWREHYVQKDENMGTAGDFIAAESTLIVVGPAQAVDAMQVLKLGLTPSVQVSQNIPQQRIYEIGSMRCHIVNGIPVGGLQIQRMIYNGPSLMRALHGASFDDKGVLTTNALAGLKTQTNPAQNDFAKKWLALTQKPDKVMDGHSNTALWLSVWDTRFKLPTGIGMYMQDVRGNAVGGVYFEGFKVGSHQFGQSAGQMIMMESISGQFDRAVPIVHGIGN